MPFTEQEHPASAKPERFDDLTVPSPEDFPPVIAQVELTGEPRSVVVGAGKIHRGDTNITLTQERVVRIVVGYNTATGEHIARPLADTTLNGEELPHEPLARYGTIYENADEGSPTLRTARKKGASTRYIDTNGDITRKGGNPNYRIQKPAHSFGLPNTHEQIYGKTSQTSPEPPAEADTDDLDQIEW